MATNIEARDETIKCARSDWKKGMKYKEIAKKYGVSESTVKSWASRYWKNGKGRNQTKKRSQPSANKKLQPHGAPKGNQNACGNGAPHGNDNAVKHGGYSAVYWDTLSDEERALIEDMPQDEETLLIDQIKMYSVRERRLLIAIRNVKEQKGNQVLSSVSRTEQKRAFATEEEKELYNEIQAEKIAEKKILPGETYSLYTLTESKDSALSRLEAELTRVQNAKTKAIATLSKLNIEKERLALIREKDDIETEDTEETDGVIYGENIS